MTVVFVAGEAYNLGCGESRWMREVIDAVAAAASPAACVTTSSGAR
jgi:hypothetical protein